VETTSTAMMVPVLAILDSLVVTVISALAPTTASATGTASTAHATAAPAGLVTIAHRRCALAVALAMASASTQLVCVNQATLVLTALS